MSHKIMQMPVNLQSDIDWRLMTRTLWSIITKKCVFLKFQFWINETLEWACELSMELLKNNFGSQDVCKKWVAFYYTEIWRQHYYKVSATCWQKSSRLFLSLLLASLWTKDFLLFLTHYALHTYMWFSFTFLHFLRLFSPVSFPLHSSSRGIMKYVPSPLSNHGLCPVFSPWS